MRLTHIAIGLAVLAGAALAQSVPPSGPPKKPGSVAGIVTNAVTGQPVKKATVTLHSSDNWGSTERFAYVALTDAEGHFKMASVEPGQYYTVTVRCPGFFDGPPSSSISVGEEQAVTGIALELPPLGVISGKVVDEEGDAIRGANVQAFQIFYQDGARRVAPATGAQTDDPGSYRLFDLRPGRTFVAVTVRDMNSLGPNIRLHSDQLDEAYPATFYTKATEFAGASPARIVAGSEIGGVDFHLKKVHGYHIRGRAVDAESRQSVHGASVLLSACGSEQSIGQQFAPVQQDGSFDLKGILPGQHCLKLQPQSGTGSFAQQTVSVGGQDVNDLVLPVWPASELHGTVVFESAPPAGFQNFVVHLRSSEAINSANAYALVKADYSFVLPNIFPILYELLPWQLPPGFYLKSIQYGEHDSSDGYINVTSAAAPLTLVLASDSAKLSVTVEGPGGSPSAGVQVFLTPSGSHASRHDLFKVGYSGPTNAATFTGVAPGDYKIFAVTNGDDGLIEVEEFRQFLENWAGSVSLQTNDSQSVKVEAIPVELVDEAKKKLQ